MESRLTNEHNAHQLHSDPDAPFSVSHLVRTLESYKPTIIITLCVISVLYAIAAIAWMLYKPSQEVTSVRFHLNFPGADRGQYPSGAKFNASTLVSASVLLKVYQANGLSRFTTFEKFLEAVVVLESNPALERLNNDYQARLQDPRLTPLDRERLIREFDSKRESLAKDEFALVYTRNAGSVPSALVRKTLSDILVQWANDAQNEQALMDFPTSVPAPSVINPSPGDPHDVLIQAIILRSKISQVLASINMLARAPGAENIRVGVAKTSLYEIQMRLENLLRFRLDTLIAAVRSGGLVQNPALANQFMERQLAYDTVLLQAMQQRVDAIRESVALYAMKSHPELDLRNNTESSSRNEGKTGEVTPMLSDSFLDRLVAMTSQSEDVAFRHTAADEYRRASVGLIPVQAAVAFDKEMIELAKKPAGSVGAFTLPQANAELAAISEETKGLVQALDEVHETLSRTMNPASQVYSITQSATTVVERVGDVRRTLLGFIFVLLLSSITIVVGCLLHNRMKEEEDAVEHPLPA